MKCDIPERRMESEYVIRKCNGTSYFIVALINKNGLCGRGKLSKSTHLIFLG